MVKSLATEWLREAEKQKLCRDRDGKVCQDNCHRVASYLANKCLDLQHALAELVNRECEDCENASYSDEKSCNEKNCLIAKYLKLLQ